MGVVALSGNNVPLMEFAQHIMMTAHKLSVNTENAKIGLAQTMVDAFKTNFSEEKFFTVSERWAPISSEWKRRKRMLGLRTGILKERSRMVNSIKYKTWSRHISIFSDPSIFNGPDKRHMDNKYVAVHNLGLLGSAGPHGSTKRQFMGYIPSSTRGKYSQENVALMFAKKLFLGVPGKFTTPFYYYHYKS